MDPVAAFNHLLNFLAPALALAVAVPVLAALWQRCWPGWQVLWRRMAASALAGAAVLVAGLVWSGRDGKMLTYLALCAVVGALTALWPLKRPARTGPRGR